VGQVNCDELCGHVRALAEWRISEDNKVLVAGGYFPNGIDASGDAHLAAYNGTSWSSLGQHGASDTVKALAIFDEKVIAGGDFVTIDNVGVGYIGAYNGSWVDLGGGANAPVECLAVWAGHLYAGGHFTQIGGVSADHIARWNGLFWEEVNGGTDGPVYSIAPDYAGVVVGGEFSTAGPGVPASNIARFNGEDWSGLGSGTNDRVQALRAIGTQTFVGGRFTTAGGLASTYIALREVIQVGIGDDAPLPGSALRLAPAVPNPFRGGARVVFEVPTPGPATLEVYDIRGRRVRVLREGPLLAGEHDVFWDATDDAGRSVAAGVYFLRLVHAGETVTRKVVRLE
jgi:hypothetical protein